jgi:hypothetical protein
MALPTAAAAFAVTNALNEILLCIDGGDAARFAALFTADGVVEVVLTGTVKTGSAELAALCDFLHGKFSGCTHWEGNVVLKAGPGGEVVNTSYWQALDGGEVVSTGRHDDVFVEADGVWRCRRRVIRHTWTKAGGHTKASE